MIEATQREVVVGRFPPPIGGVSVFVKRKYEKLQADGADFVDLGSRFWIFRLVAFRFGSGRRYQLNSGSLRVLFLFFFLGILPRTIIYDHNSSRHYRDKPLARALYFFFVKRTHGIKVVHAHLRATYEAKGLGDLVDVESPFIAPNSLERDLIIGTYPNAVLDFMRDNSSYKIASSAWRYVDSANGSDLYGITALLALIRTLRAQKFPVRCLLAFGEFDPNRIPERTLTEIRCLEADSSLVLMEGQREFWPIYRHIDLFLRLTSTDGESISVLEAQHFGCKVLASNVVPRPPGVITYNYGCHKSLLNVFLSNLEVPE